MQQTRYLHRDHLGSVIGVTDEAGGVVSSRSYDVWGQRRNADWTDASAPLLSAQSKRGYTGHEHLEDVGLIHMNGRVYDPAVVASRAASEQRA